MTGISIVVPVGPNPAYKEYLSECLDSIRSQMTLEDELVVVDDMAHVNYLIFPKGTAWIPDNYKYVINHWLLGCAASWNIGVGVASNEFCILMGSDDKLLPGCLEACRKRISHKPDPLGFYNLTIRLSSGETTSVFNNAAMVSKALWRYTGGFPLSASVGAPDALLISMMLVHMKEHLHQLEEGKPLYWCRQHPNQETQRSAAFFHPEVISIRNKETARFMPNPEWAKGLK